MSASRQLPDKMEFLLYKTEDGRIRIETRLVDETLWLTINQMAELFGIDKSGISRHLKNIFEVGELQRESVVAVFATTAADEKTYQVEYFNLDAIISVGYRVNSIRGTQFRIWATQKLKEYIVKGFTLDDERLKEAGDGRYFEELLARIRDIRSSEKVVNNAPPIKKARFCRAFLYFKVLQNAAISFFYLKPCSNSSATITSSTLPI